MFRFLTNIAGDWSHPLQTQRSASAWLRQLPAGDAISRQLQVIQALDEVAQSAKRIDFSCLAAVGYLDAELGPDRGQLFGQYVEHCDGRVAVAERIWQAAYDISQAFIAAYRKLLDQAVDNAGDPRWKREIAPLTARLIHHYGVDAKLRTLKSERWIPHKWVELNRLYRRAIDMRIERVPCGRGAGADADPRRTIEQEYIAVLLTHLVNTGTLAPAQVDWVLAQTLAWSKDLTLADKRSESTAFAIDVDGKRGLVRNVAADAQHTLRYLDTRPLCLEIEREIGALCKSGETPEGKSGVSFEPRRATVLEKLRAMIAPDAAPTVSREPRAAVSYEADVRIGLARICTVVPANELRDTDLGGNRRKNGAAAKVTPLSAARSPADRVAMSDPGREDAPMWRVQNRSHSGLRISAQGSGRQGLTLGAIVAVRSRDGGDWMLGVIRRLVRSTSDKIDFGISVIALKFAPIALHAKRHAREDMGFVVDGVDVSTIGARFEGLYLPPPSRPNKPLAERSVVVPASEFAEGRTVIAMAPQAVYTLVMRELIESHGDWCWTTIEVVGETARS